MEKPSEITDKYWVSTFSKQYLLSLLDSPNNKIINKRSGKWLIFDHISVIDQIWEKVRNATTNNQLGYYAKVSTAKPNPNSNDLLTKVICVHTYDFNNQVDVLRVADRIRSLGIENKLIYKLDKDVGKYSKDGHTNLAQKELYAERYYSLIKKIKQHAVPNIYIIENKKNNKIEFLLKQEHLSYTQFENKILYLKRLGFIPKEMITLSSNQVLFQN